MTEEPRIVRKIFFRTVRGLFALVSVRGDATAGGYDVSDSTGEFLASTPAVQADLRAAAPGRTVFGRTVVERFSNPSIQDALTRICADTSDRIPKFLLPVARERLTAGGRSPMCAAVVAAWARYAEGTDEQGKPIDVVDPRREEFMAAARSRHSAPTAFIENRQVFGDIAGSGALVEDYSRVLTAIHARGVRAALRELLQR